METVRFNARRTGILKIPCRPSSVATYLRKLGTMPSLHMLLLALSLVCFKLFSLEVVSRTYLGCQWCMSKDAIPYEFEYLLYLISLHLLSCISRWRVLAVTLRIFVVLAVILTSVDLIVTHEFWVRLTPSELFKFINEIGALGNYLGQLSSDFWLLAGAMLALAFVSAIVVRYLKANQFATSPFFLYGMIGCALAGCEVMEVLKVSEYHDVYLRNSLQAFFSKETSSAPYSKPFESSLQSKSPDGQVCMKGSESKSDVILLVVESLSMFDSALFSGINDWMPEFDAISREGIQFSNFYANGVTTEQGLIALLTGEPPIKRGVPGNAFLEQFSEPVQTLPRMMHDLGYESVFLTTGNLGFVGKGEWLKKIGFDYIEGHDAAFYNGMKRFQFDAAADEALYARAMLELQKKKATTTFMTLETVTTHLPNIDPATGARSPELTYRYADHQLGNFVRRLKSIRFFEHGTLIVTADHRAMVPMSSKEKALYGDWGYARIPFTILGGGLPSGQQQANFSQSDLLPSLKNWLGKGRQCLGQNQGAFLPTASHVPNCIYTNRSYGANNVFVRCSAEDFTIRLNGDDTDFVASLSKSSELINEVHRLRLGMGFQ